MISTNNPSSDILLYNMALQGLYITIFLNMHIMSILYNKPIGCNSGSTVFINNYSYALHVWDALCVHHQEHYKL